MATIKSFTSVEQSRKLAEILPIKSADMYYTTNSDCEGKIIGLLDVPLYIGSDGFVDTEMGEIYAWSLAALLELLPKRLQIEDNVCELSVYLYGLYYWNITNGNPCFESKYKDNLVDACYEMIIRLHELNLL